MKDVSIQTASSAWGFRQFDVWLFRWMRAGFGARPGLLPAARTIAHGSWLPMTLTLLIMVAALPSGGRTLLKVLAVATLAQLVSKRCAMVWAAPRPFAVGLSDNHLKHGPRAGLPSTHATVMAAVVGCMAVAAPGNPLLAVLVALALATGWARIYAGAHFPSDVLLGLGLGSGLGWAAARLLGLG